MSESRAQGSVWIDERSRSAVESVPGPPGAPALVVVTGEFDAADDRLSSALNSVLADGADRLVVDMTEIRFIDSSVIRALLVAQGTAVSRGGWLRLVWTSEAVGGVLEMCGISELFPQFETVAAATAGEPEEKP